MPLTTGRTIFWRGLVNNWESLPNNLTPRVIFLLSASVATKPSLEECDVTDEWIDRACMEYSAKLDELDRLLKETKASSGSLNMGDQVEPIKLADVPQQKPGAASPQLQEALTTAKRMTDEHGIHSPEARVAWETVEEIASASERNDALGGKMSAEECLVDVAMEACAALNELNRVMSSRNKST